MPSNYSADPNLTPIDSPVPALIDAAADRYGVDRNLAHTVAQMESNYNPKARSGVGAIGVMQLMPGTAQSLGVKNPWDAAQNIDGGVKYLAQLSDKFGGDPRLVMAGYNAGPGAVHKYGGVPPFTETQNYVANGMRKIGSAGDAPAAPAAPDWSSDANLTPVEAAQPAAQDLTPVTIPAPPPVASLGLKAPPTEPPGTPAPAGEKSALGFINNLGTSAYNNLISPIVHPYQTLSGISNLLEGIHELGGGMPVPGMQGRQAVQGLTDLYKQRYGSIEGFKNAFYKDPVGILSDLVTVASAGGVGVGAAQDFIRAAGLTDAALAAKNTFADAVASAAKGPQAAGAFFKGAAQAVPEAAKSAVNRGIDLSLGGPHAMVLGAKAQFGKQILQAGIRAMKEAWAGAPEAPEAAAEATPVAAPVTTPSPAPAAAPSPQVPLPPERGLPAPAIVTPPPADASAVTAVPATYPEVEPGFTRPAATPGTTGTPWPGMPAASGLSFDELARSLTGKSPTKLTVAERASVQGIYDRITQGVPPEPAPSPRVMPQAQAAQVFPEAYPQPVPPATQPVPASQPPATAPEPAAPPASASSAAQALYDELRRSGTLEPEPAPAEKPAFEQRARDAKVDKLYELITTKKIPQDWVARFTPESWRILAHEVGVPEPSAATIRQLKARLADYYKPRTLPATTPAEAQAAFDAARARVQ